MKKLIYRENDDQKVFFENEEQFSDWVSHQESGTLFAVDDHNNLRHAIPSLEMTWTTHHWPCRVFCFCLPLLK